MSGGGEGYRRGGVPVDENTCAGATNNTVKMEFVAVEGRAPKQGGTQVLARNSAVGPPSDPRSRGVDIRSWANMRVIEVNRILCLDNKYTDVCSGARDSPLTLSVDMLLLVDILGETIRGLDDLKRADTHDKNI